MTVTPSGVFRLGTVCFESDYKNVLDFPNETARSNYFNSITSKTFTDFTYMKKNDAVVVGENIDKLIGYNYCWYQNSGFTNKTYYCFITNMEYLSENSTRITFTTDVYQTYLFDKNMKPCFVVREHTNDDSIGANTIPEELETGEYIMVEDYTKNSTPYQTLNYIMGATIDPFIKNGDKFVGAGGDIYDGIYSGISYFYFDNPTDLRDKLVEIDGAGQGDAVYTIFMYPDELFTKSPFGTSNTYGYVTPSNTIKAFTLAEVFRPTTMCEEKTYTPRNKKLLTYPYTYFQVTNNAGTVNNIPYEDINEVGSGFAIDMRGILTSGGNIITFIEKAKNFQALPSTIYTPLVLSASKLPVCCWNSDVYVNWLTQNGVNLVGDVLKIGVGVTGGMGFTLGSILSGNLLGAIGGVTATGSQVADIFSMAGKLYEHSLAPDTIKGQANIGSPLLSMGELEPRCYQMSIKTEYAKVIDGFFDMFGYKTNRVKLPNERGRQNWNYVETRNCNVCGNIPQEDLEKLRIIYNTGVTIWHNSETFLDYSANNSIV